MITCPKCNNDNADDAKHCGFCGAQLRAQAPKRTMFGMAAVPQEELDRIKAEALAKKEAEANAGREPEAAKTEVQPAVSSAPPQSAPPQSAPPSQPPASAPVAAEPTPPAQEPDLSDDSFDDSDDYDPPKKKSNTTLFIVAGVVVFLLLGCLGSGVGGYFYFTAKAEEALKELEGGGSDDDDGDEEVETDDEQGRLQLRFLPPDRTIEARYKVGEHVVKVAPGATGTLAYENLGLDPGFRTLEVVRTQAGESKTLDLSIYVPPEIKEDFEPWAAGEGFFYLSAVIPSTASIKFDGEDAEVVRSGDGVSHVRAQVKAAGRTTLRVPYSIRDQKGEEKVVLSGSHTSRLPSRGPALTVVSPLYRQWVARKKVSIRGASSAGAKLRLNGKELKGAVAKDGSFEVRSNLAHGDNELLLQVEHNNEHTEMSVVVTRVAKKKLKTARKKQVAAPVTPWEGTKQGDTVAVDAVLIGQARLNGDTYLLAESEHGKLALAPPDRVLYPEGSEIRVRGQRSGTLERQTGEGQRTAVEVLTAVQITSR